MDRYGGQIARRKRSFAALLTHMVEVDGLSDAPIPMVARCGGTAVGQLTGGTRPTLAERRNRLAHGNPFDGLTFGSLLDLCRVLITFSYRGTLTEATGMRR